MKALFIIAPENFRDEEFKVPRWKLEDAGVQVTVASTKTGPCRGMLGMKVESDTTVDKVNVNDYDAVVVSGGTGSKEFLWNNQKVLDIVKEFNKQNKVIASICMSGVVLAKAGVLKGKRATVFPTGETQRLLEWNGAKYVKDHVVVDDNIITADGPDAADEFANKIVEVMGVGSV